MITDGRTLRRIHNIDAVLEATMALLADTGVPPTPDEVAERSGVSVSSIYRYFDSPVEMYRLAAERRLAGVQHLAAIDHTGEGTLEERINRFVDNRFLLYEVAAPVGRAWNRVDSRNPAIVARRDEILAALRQQTETHFATQLNALDPTERLMVATTIDAMFQVSTVDHIVDTLGLEPSVVAGLLRLLLHRLLEPMAPTSAQDSTGSTQRPPLR